MDDFFQSALIWRMLVGEFPGTMDAEFQYHGETKIIAFVLIFPMPLVSLESDKRFRSNG